MQDVVHLLIRASLRIVVDDDDVVLRVVGLVFILQVLRLIQLVQRFAIRFVICAHLERLVKRGRVLHRQL